MRMNRAWWVAIGVAGVILVTAACGSGDAVKNEAGVARKPTVGATPAKPTTTVPAATTVVPTTATPTTVKPAPPTPTTAKPTATTVTPTTVTPTTVTPTTVTPTTVTPPTTGPSHPDHIDPPGYALAPNWWMTASPSRAPAGTTVRLDGHGFDGASWKIEGGDLWLSGGGSQSSCGLLAQADAFVHVGADGHLIGSFIVPDTGFCEHTSVEVDTGGHMYSVTYQCVYCSIGVFEVMPDPEVLPDPDEAPGTWCGNILFITGVKGDIYAERMPCDEAYTFVRDHGWEWKAENGPDHVEVGGFTCDKVSMSTLPQSKYMCTKGIQTVWFVSS